MSWNIDQEYIRESLRELVRTDSRNPNLTPDGPGEEKIGRLMAAWMDELGLEVKVYPLTPGRVNVVGILPGNGGGRSLMLNGHTDTVGVQGMEEPFSAAVRGGRLYGRGAQDMKGSLAAMLGAVKALADGGIPLRGDVIFAAVADEEDRSLGTRDLLRHHRADGAVVTEPTEMEIVRAHRGLIWYEVETTGRAAHGSRFQEGIDAIGHMGRFLTEMEKLGRNLIARPGHPLAGPPSLHAGRIEGGTDICTYPASCRLQVDRRTVPGEDPDRVTGELEDIIRELGAEDPLFKAAISILVQRPPLQTPADSPLVTALENAYRSRLDRNPLQTGAAYWSDAALLAEAGMEAVLLGPVGGGLHAAEEWVSLESVYQLAEVLAGTAAAYCGQAD